MAARHLSAPSARSKFIITPTLGTAHTSLGQRLTPLRYASPAAPLTSTVFGHNNLYSTTTTTTASSSAPQRNFVNVEQKGHVRWVTLNRPEVHNAFNEVVIAEMTQIFRQIETDTADSKNETRCVVLTGNGQSFSAGADLNWMKKMATYTEAENERDSHALFDMMNSIYTCPVPVIGRINGPAIGGGAGMVAACDFSFAVSKAIFGFTEVKLGLLPAVISPFVINKIRPANCSRYFLTGERFGSDEALRMSLIHDTAPTVEELDKKLDTVLKEFCANSVVAVKDCKKLIHRVGGARLEEGPVAMKGELCQLIARARVSPEGQEGLSSFLERRSPSWRL
eukprot:TRINITY_DN4404_c0_g1_i3.p1 TRINITY_DN4404_c0_g1~~TRINITY_DN4404_c0_g1_i3.p1  ORF type:complete len:338 (+),score=48.58 TRINITY_DN4404_c0_g1_i3:82-1095(+)